MDGRIVRCDIISLICQSAATSDIVKCFTSLRVISVVSSTGVGKKTFTWLSFYSYNMNSISVSCQNQTHANCKLLYPLLLRSSFFVKLVITDDNHIFNIATTIKVHTL